MSTYIHQPQSNSRDLKFVFEILRSNDELLKRRIEELIVTDDLALIYREIINSYFKELTLCDENTSAKKRSQIITKYLKNIWQKHGKGETYKLFENFNMFETFLFELPNYRGHYIHQFNVFLLGYYLLNKLLENNQIKNVFHNISDEPYFTWMISSTFHDMGYTIQEIENWFSNFLEMFLKVNMKYSINIDDILTRNFYDYVAYISEYHLALLQRSGLIQWHFEQMNRKDMKIYDLLLTRLKMKEHGIIGALLFIHSILVREKFLDNQSLIYRDFPIYIMPACHAISAHHFNIENLTIEFERFPFLFMLILCDELQDWGRSKDKQDQSKMIEVDVIEGNHPKIIIKLKVFEEYKLKSLSEIEKKLKCSLFDVQIEAEYKEIKNQFNIKN